MITLKGTQQVIAALERKKLHGSRTGAVALKRTSRTILKKAKSLTPVATGALRDSGYTEDPAVVGEMLKASVGFKADYAGYVHEDLTAKHPVGQAKFLEAAVRESKGYFEHEMRYLWRGGSGGESE